jgi:hypothetical protein
VSGIMTFASTLLVAVNNFDCCVDIDANLIKFKFT